MTDQIETKIVYNPEWKSCHRLYATIYIGDYEFTVSFRGGFKERYERMWSIVPKIDQSKKDTGLFPKINIALKEITEKFIREIQPNALIINGIDKKRNQWNKVHYRVFDTPGYTFYIVRDCIYARRATEDGITGVGWIKNGYIRLDNYEDPDSPFVKKKKTYSFWSSFGF
jgi:hypothetical protein